MYSGRLFQMRGPANKFIIMDISSSVPAGPSQRPRDRSTSDRFGYKAKQSAT